MRRPTDRANFSARVDHALTKAFTLKAHVSTQHRGHRQPRRRRASTSTSRAYSRQADENLPRALGERPDRPEGLPGDAIPGAANSQRSFSLTDAPAIIVLDAFTSGGAQIDGGRARQRRRAGLRSSTTPPAGTPSRGFLLEGGRYRSDEVRNCRRHVHVRRASMPTTPGSRPRTPSAAANPLVEYRRCSSGPTCRTTSALAQEPAVSVGLRQEVQTHMDDQLEPRAARRARPGRRSRAARPRFVAAAACSSTGTTPDVYEQTLRVDGVHQVDRRRSTRATPTHSPAADVVVLPSGRIVQIAEPGAADHARHELGGRAGARQGYARVTRHLRRTRAATPRCAATTSTRPLGRQRPDPASGTVTQVESTARSSMQCEYRPQLQPALASTFLFVNYTLGRADERDRRRRSACPPTTRPGAVSGGRRRWRPHRLSAACST